MPCRAKHLLSWVLSITPGNFLAEKTWNGSENTDARTGAVPWLITGAPFVVSEDCVPTSTKLIFRLGFRQLLRSRYCGTNLPEGPLCPNTEILENKPHANFVLRVRQTECTRAETADQVASEHPARSTAYGRCGR